MNRSDNLEALEKVMVMCWDERCSSDELVCVGRTVSRSDRLVRGNAAIRDVRIKIIKWNRCSKYFYIQ